jgi:UDP-N-acetylmuramoyl-L-alanyl-D-glutamate--2,6-diaminopimelate ligase
MKYSLEKNNSMKLLDLLQDIEVVRIIGNANTEVTGIQSDSRRIESGNIFVAQKGTTVDGHMFIAPCIAQGAGVVVMDDATHMPTADTEGVCYVLVKNSDEALGKMAHTWYGKPSQQLKLIGVTGTNGKTTTATLLYRLFKALGHKVGLLSTVVNYVNDESIPATHTTPDALSLNALLAQMVSAGCTYAFMEVSSHAIAQERIAGLEFAGALFTNLTRDHLDYHKTFDHYRDTKKQLFDRLSKSAFAVTNYDDKNGLVMTQNTQAKVYTYSTRSMADFRGKILEESFEGMLLRMQSNIGTVNTEVFVPLVGRFNVSNLLLIYACGVALGIEPLEVLRILSSLPAVNGRFETIRSDKGWTAVVDYAHTPDAVENVLKTINEIVNSNATKQSRPAQVITVVGCGGNRDKGKRPIMARIAFEQSTVLILTSDNPRDEEPQDILREMAAGLTSEELQRVLIIEDRASAIKTACTIAQRGDVVLVAGKGHENYQIIKGVKHHFDDHEVVRMCL